jgi:two-component system phosphate regulon sensor histidine kinase PhoR
MAPVRLSRLAESTFHSLEHVAKERGVKITVGKEMPGIVCGNFTALEELLANLVKNAITFSPKGGVVRITAKMDGASVRLAIADNGKGIAEEDLPHIFEPFYQSGGKKHGGGSGLGLTLVKQIAKLHHAKIEVKTKIGSGTTFTVEFPR